MFRWLLLTAVSSGCVFSSLAAVVFPADTEWRYLPGKAEASPQDPMAWRLPPFDDSSWFTGKGPFYYEDQPTSANAYTGNTLLSDMRSNYSSLFLRKSFTVTNPGDVRELQITALSDDGFIAWINGAEVVRFNMPPGEPSYRGLSLGALSEPVQVQNIVLDQSSAHLVTGSNVLAVQAFNSGLGNSSDFVISVALSSSVDDQPPTLKYTIPTANALVRALNQVEVGFTEDVTGVDASDLLVNGQPTTNLTAFNGSQYVFDFPQPANGKVTLSWSAGHGIRDLSSAANPFGGASWSYTLDPNATPPGLIISEFMADNKKTLHDEDGDSSDWIELFNAGATAVSLNGYYLTMQSNVTQWRFPNVTILPNEYRVVFASGKNRAVVTNPLHTNFKLEKAGGYLALLDPAGKMVSEVGGYPAQLQDVSFGRDRANPTLFAFFPQPSPGSPNTTGGPGFSPEVQFSRAGGTFSSPFSLTLTTSSPDAVIRYTLDGSAPTETSTLYSGPIPVSSTVQVRAGSFSSGLLPGPLHSESYLALDSNVRAFSSDLPVIVIHNFGAGSVPASVRQFANVSVYEPGYGRTSLTNLPTLSTRAGINLRGSSTMYLPKSSFRVEFWNDYNDDAPAPLLGMPAESDWVLYACNNFEPVLLHNKFIHDLSRQVGRYSPRARFVEVYVNTGGGSITSANYNGVYVLLEKIKQGPERVDIDELQPEQTKAPQVTGGYLMSVDRSAPGEGQIYASGLGLNALSPQWLELSRPERAPQLQYITQYLDNLYTVLNSTTFADPVKGYAQYVDVDAAIDHHILNVLAFNVDALRLSGYVYKPREGKLTLGPLWDFDRALGSTDGRDSNPRLWRSASGDLGTDMFNSASIFSNPWYSRMFRDIDFWQHWIDRWQELRRDPFALTNLHGLVDSLANQVREAERREVARWPGLTSPRGGSYQAEVNMMKAWLSNRVDFIDTNFLAAPQLSSAGGPITPGASVSISAPAGATVYYTLDGTDPRANGGEVSIKALSYTGPITLTQNARLVTRARNLNHKNLTGANKPPLSSPWSGPVAATFVAATPSLTVTELMYHPAPSAPGAGDADDYEFIELKNTGSQTLSLIGFKFTRGIDYTFTSASGATSLGPGQYVVVVKNRAAFLRRYPNATAIAGEYAGSLDNDGERITLQGPLQEPVLDFTYNNSWYPASDGAGFSLVLVDEAAGPGSAAAAWRISSTLQGSPAQQDPPANAIPQVLVNEALTHTDPPQVDSIELFNPNTAPVDISGWFLSDDLSAPTKFVIPPGTVLPPNGYVGFDETQFNPNATGFALSSLGDQVYLFSGDGRNPTGYAQGFNFGAAANGVTFGRYVTSTGTEKFVAQVQPTLNAPNAGPKVGPLIFTEIMFNPPPLGATNNTRDEFVEIYNNTAQTQPLYDPNAPTNTWRLRGGIEFDFPTNITIASGQAVLVVNFDPAVDAAALAGFVGRYGMSPTAVPLFGPYKGNLNNASDHVALYKPDPPEPAGTPNAGYVPYVLVDDVHYADQSPWPTGANGTGASLQRVSSAEYADDPINWQSAAATPGSYTPAEPLRITGVEVSASQAVLHFTAAPGKAYSVLFRDSLTSGSWAKLADVPASAVGGPVKVTDSGIANVSNRFYQLMSN